jgi:hypothetical protein
MRLYVWQGLYVAKVPHYGRIVLNCNGHMNNERVLDMLGDEVAAENARAASISLGIGEGGAMF